MICKRMHGRMYVFMYVCVCFNNGLMERKAEDQALERVIGVLVLNKFFFSVEAMFRLNGHINSPNIRL
jgi:hypothetical protein